MSILCVLCGKNFMNLTMNTKRVKYLLFCTLFLLLAAETALSQQVQFEEVTSASGIVMSYDSRFSTCMAWGDYDNDGLLDVYVTSWGTSTSRAQNALYRNTGSGIFQNVASMTGVDLNDNSAGAAWGDFDNDGDLDLFVANFYEGDVVFQNMLTETGTANFVDVTTAMNFINKSVGRSKAAVWGDFNNDGFIDLYVAKYWGKNALYENNGGSSFTLHMDWVVADIRDSEYATWVDYDDDGDVDLYVVNREQENRLYRNDNGEFTAAYNGLNDTQFGRFAAWADYDNNNMLDLFIGNIGANSLYQQASGRIFTEVAGVAGVKSAPNAWDTWGATWGDYDGDGDLDLFFAGGFDEIAASETESFTGTFGNILLENNGGTFADRTEEANLLRGAINFSTTGEVGSFASAAAFADYDNDGDPDLMVTNTYQNLLFKNLNPTNNYLKVRVQGKGGGFNNRNGLGSKVRVYNINNPGVVIAMQEITSAPQPMISHFALPLGETYDVKVTFLKNGTDPPETVTVTNVNVPLDTVMVIIQH